MQQKPPPIAPHDWRPYAEPVPPLRRQSGLLGVVANPMLAAIDLWRRARHYSPRRRRSVWQQWLDRSLWISLLLSPAVVLALTTFVHQSAIDSRTAAMFWLSDADRVEGAMLRSGREPVWSVGHPIGVWELRATHRLQGWPLPVLESARGLEFLPTQVHDAQISAEQIRPVFDQLAQRDQELPTAGGLARVLPWNFVADSLLLWPPLFALLTLLVGLIRFIATFLQRRAATQASEQVSTGRCARCGYDLRGSLQSARCPECGAISDR